MELKERNSPVIKERFLQFIETLRGKIVFAFICGSVAKNRTDVGSDIDVFICVKVLGADFKTRFRKWYERVHRDLKFKPDNVFPGEIMTLQKLDANLRKAQKSTPNKNIKDRGVHDGVVWAGMLCSKTLGFVGNRNVFLLRKTLAKKILIGWKKDLMQKFKAMSSDSFLKEIVKYEK
ncbi:MAG: nucleotidyltransferase domain-containing protein [Candidatus Jorgensenbacteria bacterium]